MWFKEWTSCNNLFCLQKKSPKPEELYFPFQRASCSTISTAYLSSSLSTAPASLFWGCFLFLSHIHDFRFCNFKLEKKPGVPKGKPLLSCYKQKEKQMLSGRKFKKNIFTIFNSHLHRAHQTMYVFLHPVCQMMTLMQGEHSLRQSFISLFFKCICKKQHDRKQLSSQFLLHFAFSNFQPKRNWS